jgi:hypothetical protein
MEEKKWTEELFPGIYRVGNDASDTGGNQAILIEKDGHNYLIFTDGFDYGSWVGKLYDLTEQEKEKVMSWEEGSYEMAEWLRNRSISKWRSKWTNTK